MTLVPMHFYPLNCHNFVSQSEFHVVLCGYFFDFSLTVCNYNHILCRCSFLIYGASLNLCFHTILTSG